MPARIVLYEQYRNRRRHEFYITRRHEYTMHFAAPWPATQKVNKLCRRADLTEAR